jgi:hypothetical protein
MKLKLGIIKVVSVATSFCATADLNLAKNAVKSCWESWPISTSDISNKSPTNQKAKRLYRHPRG